MAGPRFTPAELEAFIKAGQSLAKRTVPLTEAGAKSLANLAPHEQVALDEALMGGAKLGEVQGAGKREALNETYDVSTGKLKYTSDPLWGWTPSTDYPREPESVYAATVGQHDYGFGAWDTAGNQAADAQANNRRINEQRSYLDPADWPKEWRKVENIPAAVGTVAAGAGVLAASNAQAATGDDLPADLEDLQGGEQLPDDLQEVQAGGADLPDDLQDLELDRGGSEPMPPTGPGILARPSLDAPQEQGFIYQPPKPTIRQLAPAPLMAQREQQAWDAIRKFKQEHITPLISAVQAHNRQVWFGYDPNLAKSGIKPQGGSVGSWLRETRPAAALAAESVGRIALGETELNRGDQETGVFGVGQGNESKLYAEAMAQAEQKLGPKLGPIYIAATQAFASGYANLPFYLIPGVGSNPIVQGATGGFALSVVDPEQDPETAVKFGAAGGAVIGGIAKAGGKLVEKVAEKLGRGQAKRLSEFLPIAVLHADDEPALAEAIFSMPPGDMADTVLKAAPEPVIPNKDLRGAAPGRVPTQYQQPPGVGTGAASPRALRAKATPPEPPAAPVVVAVDVVEGKVNKQGLALGTKGPHTVEPPKNFKGKIVHTPRALEAIHRNPTDPNFRGILPEPTLIEPVQVWRNGDEFPAVASIEFEVRPDVYEGSVLVLEGGFGSGTARLYNVKDPALHKEILKRRVLTEVDLGGGKKVRGYLSHGEQSESLLLPVDPSENIPLGTTEGVDLTDVPPEKVRVLSGKEIEGVLNEREGALDRQKFDAVIQQADAEAAQADIEFGGDGSGGHLPPPPPMDPPPPPPPNPHNVDPTEGIKLKYADSVLGRLNKWQQRKLLNPTVRGFQDVADLAFSSHSVDTFERLRDDTYKQLQRLSPEISKKTFAEQRTVLQNIDRFVVGHIDASKLKALHPELSKGLHDALQQHKAQVAANETHLRALGMLGPEDDMASLLGGSESDLEDYATRMYFRHLMKPGEWAKMFKRDQTAVDKVLAAIERDVYTEGKNAILDAVDRKAAARRHLDFLLGEPELIAQAKADPEAAWTQVVSHAGGSLKQREVMTWWKKLAMGEIDNAFVRMAETRARQKQLIVQGEMWKAASINPELTTAGDAFAEAEARGHTVKVPMDPRRFGQAAGRFMHPEAWEGLVQAPLAQRNAATTFSKFQNALKFNQTVGNPGSWVTNFFANGQGAALSNLVNPFASPFKIGRGMKLFTTDHAAHRLAPGISGDLARDRFTRAMELGIIGSDYSTAEFRESATVWQRALEAEAQARGGKVNPLELFPEILRKSANQGKEFLARKYGAIDSMWKYAVYTAGLEKAGISLVDGSMKTDKAIKFIGKRYRPGMTEARIREQAELEIAQRIHYSFPMLDRVGEGVAKAGAAAGLINPYLKVKTELMRNYAQLPRRFLNEPGMKANLMGYAALVGGTLFGIKELRDAYGMSQQEVDAAFASSPTSVQRFKPGAMALPWRASNGKVQLLDLTQMAEPLTWLQGNPQTAEPVRFLQNAALSPIDGTLLEPEIMSFLAQSGMVDAAYARPNVPEWQEGGAKMLTDTIGRLGPGLFRNTYSTLERGAIGFNPKGGRGPDAPIASLATTGFNLLMGPNRLVESGGEEDKTRAIQAKVRELEAAEKALNDIGPKNPGQSMGLGTMPLDKAEAFRKAKLVLEKKKAELAELQRLLGR